MANDTKTGGQQWELREERMLRSPSRIKKKRNRKGLGKSQILISKI
jgi:hypothetical protein